MNQPLSIRNRMLAILACLLWSSAFVTAKQALEHQTPLTLAGMRFILAGFIQIPFCKNPFAPFRLIRHEFITVLQVSLFHTILLYGTFFIGLQWARGAEAAIMVGAGPLASVILAHLLMKDDKMQWRTLLGLGLGLAGITLISLAAKPWNPGGLKAFFGLMLLLSGSFISATGNIVVAKRKSGLNPIVLNSAQMLLGGPVLLFIALFVEGKPTLALPPSFYLQLLWLAIISAVAFGIWFHLLTKTKVSKLNLWKFIVPLSGAILSWIFIPAESPTLPALLGMVLIVSGLIIGQRDAIK